MQISVFLSASVTVNARVPIEAASVEEAKQKALQMAQDTPEEIDWIFLDQGLGDADMPKEIIPDDGSVAVDFTDQDDEGEDYPEDTPMGEEDDYPDQFE